MSILVAPIISMKLDKIGINDDNFKYVILNPIDKDGIELLRSVFGNGNPDFDELEAKYQLLFHYKRKLKPVVYALLSNFIKECQHYVTKDINKLDILLNKDYSDNELRNSMMTIMTGNRHVGDLFLKNFLFKMFILNLSLYNFTKEEIDHYRDLLVKEYSEFPVVKSYIKKMAY
jgi:hypothetical protein